MIVVEESHSLLSFLEEIGLNKKEKTGFKINKKGMPHRDVSWFERGEECPH